MYFITIIYYSYVLFTLYYFASLSPTAFPDLLAIWPLVPSRVIKSLPQACPGAISRELTPFKFLCGFLKFYL